MTRTIFEDNQLRTQNEMMKDLQRTKLAQQRVATPQLYLDTQIVDGVGSGVLPITNGTPLYIDSIGTNLALSYTPPSDAWWEVCCHVGAIQIPSVAYIDLQVVVSPAPTTGYPYTITRVSPGGSHASVSRLFALSGGITYTAAAIWYTAGNGATYYHSPDVMWMNGKAWAR